MNTEHPMVSVILPTYNRATSLGRAIKSVLMQTYPHFELVVVDDGSTDDTRDVVAGFHDDRIRYLRFEQNSGAPEARNAGILKSGGDYLAFQDSDDEWMPEKLQKQMRVFCDARLEAGVVYTDMYRLDRDGKEQYWHSPEVTRSRLINPDNLDYQTMDLGIVTALIKRECFDRVGLFRRFPRFEDLELFNRMLEIYEFFHIKEPLVKYSETQGVSSDDYNTFLARKILLQMNERYLQEHPPFLANQYFLMGRSLQKSGRWREGTGHIFKAVRRNPKETWYAQALLLSFCGQRVFDRAWAFRKRSRKGSLRSLD